VFSRNITDMIKARQLTEVGWQCMLHCTCTACVHCMWYRLLHRHGMQQRCPCVQQRFLHRFLPAHVYLITP
jgi:hypothetical protein